MFAIDLLKEDGIPIKSKPESIAIAAATFAVPVIIAIVMLTLYLSSGIAIAIDKGAIVNYEVKINELSHAIELQEEFEQEKAAMESCLSEVVSSIGEHMQWSPILETLVSNMPEFMILMNLEVKQKSVQREVPKKDDPQKTVNMRVPVRTLQMSIGGYPEEDCGKAVKRFRNSLLTSRVLGPKLEDITVSQKFDKLDGRDIVSYQIECVFKP